MSVPSRSFNLPNLHDQCANLMQIIGSTHLENVQHWKFVGNCLKNILGNAGYPLFEQFTPSQFGPQDNENPIAPDPKRTWSDFKKTRYGIKSLKFLAEKLNRETYDTWKTTVIWQAALGCLKKTAGVTEIADIVKFMYEPYFVCTNIKTQIWWSYNGHCWELQSQGEDIKQRFSRELAIIFEEVYDEFSRMDQEADGVKQMADKAAFITKGLKTPGSKMELMRECSEVFLDRKFENDMDEDHFILGLPNGILDMRDFNNVHLRDSYPDDRVSLQMNAEYHPEIYSEEHPDVIFVRDFKEKLLPDPEIRKFAMKIVASCLMGGNKEKLCVINIGETAHNGKTTDAKFIRHTFGSYSGKLPLGTISGRTPDMNQANPALVLTKGTRIQQIDEASKKQEFNAAFVKLSTGNDEQTGRLLYQNDVTFTPQFTLFMGCNSAPSRIESAGDAGMDERGVLIPHTSRFTKDAPDSIEEQWKRKVFKANPHINQDLKKRIDAYLWILVQDLKDYLKNGLQFPKAVVEKTNNYQYSNNPYLQFKQEKLDITSRPIDYVTLHDLYSNYKSWFLDAYPGKRVDNKEGFGEEMIKVIGTPVGDEKRYAGVKLKTEAKRFERNGK